MSAFEQSAKSLLLGVSQQVARERLDGQVALQDNMMSDSVTGPRRRPGIEWIGDGDVVGGNTDNIMNWFTDIAGEQVHIRLYGSEGRVSVLDVDYNILTDSLINAAYLTSNRWDIQVATVGDEFFICNVSKLPTVTRSSTAANRRRGFFFVRQGAFSKRFSVSVKVDGTLREYSYTTPDGTGSGDAAASSAEQIAAQLRDQIFADLGVSGVDVRTAGAAIYLFANTSVTQLVVTTDTSDVYMVASNDQSVRLDTNLPPSLHSAANGMLIKTGADKAAVYYRYDYANSAWIEDGAPGSVTAINNMPLVVRKNPTSGDWELYQTGYEGRLSGDDETNPDPPFLTSGITGIGAFQNRLVLLAGSQVSLSSSSNPRRFYRTTTTTLVASDPIHIGASANSSAAYKFCMQFQKDLLLFSSQYQALIPANNVAIKPDTATVVITSTYTASVDAAPVSLGRTVMYPFPRSESFFGILEMLPSPYTDSQYVSQDTTQHLPRYMPVRCRFGVSSSVSNMALFAPSGDRNSLIVHEYLWSGDEKVQQAWHRWVFPYEIADAYFANDRVIVLFVQNGVTVTCSMSPRKSEYQDDDRRAPYLDMYEWATVTDNLMTVPPRMLQFDPDIVSKIKLSVATGPLAGEPVGFYTTDQPNVLRTVRSFESGEVAVGVPYTSALSPTQPFVRDNNGVVITSNKLTMLRAMLSTNRSREYMVSVTDGYDGIGTDAFDTGTLYWSSTDLDLGEPRIGADSTAIIPTRTDANRTSIVIYTDGLGELNIVGLEYVCRYLQRLRRR